VGRSDKSDQPESDGDVGQSTQSIGYSNYSFQELGLSESFVCLAPTGTEVSTEGSCLPTGARSLQMLTHEIGVDKTYISEFKENCFAGGGSCFVEQAALLDRYSTL